MGEPATGRPKNLLEKREEETTAAPKRKFTKKKKNKINSKEPKRERKKLRGIVGWDLEKEEERAKEREGTKKK